MVAINQIRDEYRLKAEAEGVQQTVAAAERLASATNAVGTASDNQTRKTVSVERALERFAAANDRAYKAQQALARGQALVTRAQEQGLAGTEAYERALASLAAQQSRLIALNGQAANSNDKVAAGFQRMAAVGQAQGKAFQEQEKLNAQFRAFSAQGAAQARALGVVEAAHTKNARATALHAQEWQNLGFQANDAVTMLASGSSVFQVIATQGGQVYQILQGGQGGVTGSLRAIKDNLIGMATPARIAGIGLLALAAAGAAAATAWGNTEASVNRALAGIGRGAGATFGDIEQMAERVSEKTGQSVSQVRDILAELAKTGSIDKAMLEPIAAISKDFEKTFDISSDKVGKSLGDMFDRAGDAARQLAAKGLLAPEIAKDVEKYEAANDQVRAQQILLDGIKERLREARDLTSGTSAFWDNIWNRTSDIFTLLQKNVNTAFGGSGGGSDAERIANLQARRDALNSPASRGQAVTDGNLKDLERRIVEADREISVLQQRVSNAGKEAADTQSNRMRDRARLIAQSVVPEMKALDDLTQKHKATERAIAAIPLGKPIPPDLAISLGRTQAALDDFRKAGGALELQEQKRAEADRIRNKARDAKTPEDVAEIQRLTQLNNAMGQELQLTERNAQANREGEFARQQAQAAIDKQTDSLRKAGKQAVETGNMFDQADASNAAEIARLSQARRGAAEDVENGLQKDREQLRVKDRLRQSLSEEYEAAAKANRQRNERADIEDQGNRSVREGIATREQATRAIERNMQAEALRAAAATAQANGDLALRDQLLAQANALIAAETRLDDVRSEAAAQGLVANQERQIALLRLEAEMVGATVAERERALAVLRATQELERLGISPLSTAGRKYVDNAVLISDLNTAKQEYERFAQEIASVVSGIFDDLFTRAADGSKDLMENMARSISRIGSRLVEQNLIIPMLSGQPGALGSMNLGGLVDTKAIGDSVGDAIKSVMPPSIQDSFAPLLKPRTNAAGQSMGVMSSPLMGGLAAAGVGGAIGYSSQSPLMGALGGGLAGLATGNPIMGIVGAGAGLLGGLFGKSEAKKQARKAMLEQLKAYAEALAEARPQIEQLSAMFRGEGVGSVQQSVNDALQRAKDAIETASKGGDQELANRLMREFPAYVARLRRNFADAFTGTLRGMRGGEGLDNTFSAAAAAATQLGESLKGFVSDAERLGAGATRNATRAARQAALDSLEPPKALTDVQERLREIQGTGTALRQVLIDLGMSARDAAEAIRDRTKSALDELRESFRQDVRSRLNDVRGVGYLNDIADLVAERGDLRTSARELGLPMREVEQYFAAAMQKIVDEAELSGKAFDRLIKRFPELRGRIDEFGKGMQTAAERAEEAARIVGYRDRAFMAGLDTSTLNGQLKAFDRQAIRERQALEQAEASRREIRELERAQHAERLKLIREYQDAAREARREAIKQARDDYRSWARDIRQYLTDLVAGPDSPLSPGDRLTAAQSQFTTQLALARGGDRNALSGITGVADSLLSAARDNYASSPQFQAIFQQVRDALAALPDQVAPEDFLADAINTMRDVLKAAVDAGPGKTATALNANFTRLDTTMNGRLSYAEFSAGLGPLATKAEQQAAKAVFDRIDLNGDGQLSKLELIRASNVAAESGITALKKAIEDNSPTKMAAALTANFDKLDTTMNGKLSKAELLEGLGPLAKKADQDAARLIFERLDKNGDNQLSKQELIRAASIRVGDQTALVKANTQTGGAMANRLDLIGNQSTQTAARLTSTGALYGRMEEVRKHTSSTSTNTGNSANNATKVSVDSARGVLTEIRSLNTTQRDTLKLLNAQFDFDPVRQNGFVLSNNMLTSLNKIVFNTANTVQALKQGASWTYSQGGYTGPGGVNVPAGIVHRGEVVFSQADVARAGGVAAVEAMRLGLNDNRSPVLGASLPMPVAMAAPIANDNAVTNGLLREIASLIKRVGEMEARIDKAGFEKVVEAVEEVADAVRSGNDRRQSGTQTAGRGAPVRPAKAA